MTKPMPKIVTAAQMRDIEARSERAGVSTDRLMERAGLAVARVARRMAGPLSGVPIVVLVGPGNNGADGLVAARHLRRWGARVAAYLCRDRAASDPKLAAARDAGVAVVSVSDDAGLARLRVLLDSAHLVIDAVLGTGRARPIVGVVGDAMGELARAASISANGRLRPRHPQVLALDLPTGLDSDTADVDPATVAADVTVALGYPKRGHLDFPGAAYVGRLEVADIGIPTGLDDDVRVSLLTGEWARAALPSRPSESHKGTFGRAMVVAGSRNFLGAASLAGIAAARVGAGLVTIAIPESLVSSVAPSAVEPTFLPLPESRRGVVSTDAADAVLDALPAYSALLVGCGLGQEPETARMVERLLLSGADLPPTVVDADGLNTLAQVPRWWENWTDNAILTPHPGEMARLTADMASSQLSRLDAALGAAGRWRKTVILKGAHTVLANADGSGCVSPFANPALATAGTGDVLAGAILGLLSQGSTLGRAASLGVYLHGAAGESVRGRLGDAGLIATDLLPELPAVMRNLRHERDNP